MKMSKFKFKVLIAFLLLTAGTVTVQALYVPSSRETSEPPEEVLYDYVSPDPEDWDELSTKGDLTFYYRESRGTIGIHDARNDYFWKTGTDLEFSKDIDDECDDTLDAYEGQFMNVLLDTFTGFTSTVNPLLEEAVVEGYNGDLKVDSKGITDTSSFDDIHVSHGNIELVTGKSYKVSVSARSLASRNIQLVLGSHVSEVLTLTNEDQLFEYTFTVSTATVTDAVLDMYFGYLPGQENNETTAYVDFVSIEEFDGTDVVADTNQLTRGDFELLDTEIVIGDEDLLASCRPVEVKLNTTYTGFANSILTIEYYDDANNIKRISSSSHVNVDMDMKTTSSDDHFVFEIDFKKQDIEVVLHMYLDEQGIRYEVLDEDVTGEGTEDLAAIIISPFLGASGGAYEEFDLTELDYGDDEVFKYKVPGYTLVPDGSGTLIRFNDNSVKLNDYNGAIYGIDIGQADHYRLRGNAYVPFKTSSMPVFGIAHGNQQSAFVAFATEGDEYMQIVSMPEENLTYYNFTYPRFEYNKQYFQVYNKSGWGYLTLYEERNHFDINIRYNFLSGDGSTGPSADYVGMAQSYRAHLIEEGLLTEINQDYTDIPIRLDFLMSDVEKGITGFQNKVTTTTSGVDRILADFIQNDITNINSGLLGWQDGGITLGDPRDTDYTREIGRKRDFRNLIGDYQDLGIDISVSQNYYDINEDMMRLRRNATQHTSGWYSRIETFSLPIGSFYFARPTKSVGWMLSQTSDIDDLGVGSYTISGITSNLTSDETDKLSRTEAKQLFMDGFAELNQDVLVNSHQPNAYLWQYTDRYLSTPIYGTQFLIESDTVPFLQLVLQNTMELYGPYSNFSFYTDSDILRMIDYNIYPNFVLTEQPAYLLTDTLSRNYYSTEYELYEDLIVHVYNGVNGALGSVINANWINRTVIENGIIVNEYDNGISIVINYTDDAFVYDGVTVEPITYQVIGG